MIIEQEYDTEIEVEKYGKSLALHQDGVFITVQSDGAKELIKVLQELVDDNSEA